MCCPRNPDQCSAASLSRRAQCRDVPFFPRGSRAPLLMVSRGLCPFPQCVEVCRCLVAAEDDVSDTNVDVALVCCQVFRVLCCSTQLDVQALDRRGEVGGALANASWHSLTVAGASWTASSNLGVLFVSLFFVNAMSASVVSDTTLSSQFCLETVVLASRRWTLVASCRVFGHRSSPSASSPSGV